MCSAPERTRCSEAAPLMDAGPSASDDEWSRWFHSNSFTVERTQTQAPLLSLSHIYMTAAYADLDNEARVYYYFNTD